MCHPTFHSIWIPTQWLVYTHISWFKSQKIHVIFPSSHLPLCWQDTNNAPFRSSSRASCNHAASGVITSFANQSEIWPLERIANCHRLMKPLRNGSKNQVRFPMGRSPGWKKFALVLDSYQTFFSCQIPICLLVESHHPCVLNKLPTFWGWLTTTIFFSWVSLLVTFPCYPTVVVYIPHFWLIKSLYHSIRAAQNYHYPCCQIPMWFSFPDLRNPSGLLLKMFHFWPLESQFTPNFSCLT